MIVGRSEHNGWRKNKKHLFKHVWKDKPVEESNSTVDKALCAAIRHMDKHLQQDKFMQIKQFCNNHLT